MSFWNKAMSAVNKVTGYGQELMHCISIVEMNFTDNEIRKYLVNHSQMIMAFRREGVEETDSTIMKAALRKVALDKGLM